MKRGKQRPITQTNLLQALAEFRYRLRSFLHFSELVAKKQHLHPRQHQLLLQIAGIAEGRSATINYLAERLGLRQNSVVELANRSVAEGLVRRNKDPCDRRRVILSVTHKGMRVLDALSQSHAHELDEYGPRLIRMLERIKSMHSEKVQGPATGRSQTARKPARARSRCMG
jgi:DNA-binding MarR family transcriptional regulator